MPWPTNTDYQEAIQTPGLCFDDAELKAGKVETSKLGLPRPFSGNFACVYKIRCNNRTYAVRCFLREFSDQQQRYQEITSLLRTANLACTVGFDFVPKGIRVKGLWCPVLKMEWVEGDLLHHVIERSLMKPANCSELARKWLELCKLLKDSRIAHGDLQHGNILIVNGQFKLIDYDGMYVPTLARRNSHEVGHPNYQHPRRVATHFGPYLDNFSAWVIYVSLVALSIDPTLWQTTGAGDECLLFRQEDFNNPDTSNAFAVLERHSSIQIQALVLMFKNLLFLEPDRIPGLDGQIPSLQVEPAITGSWIRDYVPVNSASASGADLTRSVSPSYDATWVLDFTATDNAPLEPIAFPASLMGLRTLAHGSIATAVGLATLLLHSHDSSSTFALCLLIVLLVPVNSIVFHSEYKNDSAVKARSRCQLSADQEQQEANSRKSALSALQQQREKLKSEECEKQSGLQRQIDEARLIETRDTSAVQAQLNRALADIARSRRQTETEREAGLNSLRAGLQGEINRLTQEIDALARTEAQEIARELDRLQQQHIQTYLAQQSTPHAFLGGMTAETRSALLSRYPTAANIELHALYQIKGIGPRRAAALIGWRRIHEIRARQTLPQSLPPVIEDAIKFPYTQRRLHFQQDKSQRQSRLQSETDRISAQAAAKFQQLDQDQQIAQADAKRRISAMKEVCSERIAVLVQKQLDVTKCFATRYTELDGDIRERTKDVYQQNWSLAKANRELFRYGNVSFRTLVERVLFLR